MRAVFATLSPARIALSAFLLTIGLFASLLMMPWATAGPGSAKIHDAVFVATSAVTVTGLTPVNTAEHWSFAGQVVILLGIQIGGLGIITTAALLALSITHRLGLRTRLIAQEGMAGKLGEVGSLIKVIVVCMLSVQFLLAAILVPRLAVLEDSFVSGLWHGIFYAISSFNNAGFVVHPRGLADLGHDPVVQWTLMAGVFIGSLGFPVLYVLWRHGLRISRWTLHARLTIEFSLVFVVIGAVLVMAFEGNQGGVLTGMNPGEKAHGALFTSVMMRSGGFEVVDTSALSSQTMLITDALMFAGGGSTSTAGGIKVTTVAVMFLSFLAEARGRSDSTAHGRTIPPQATRVAVSVVAMAATVVLVATIALIVVSEESLERPLFEAISAFATCGLSSGLTAELPPSGLYVLSALMLAGRVGIMTFAAALAVRQKTVRYRYPDEQPLIG